jgi:hypothetical protein
MSIPGRAPKTVKVGKPKIMLSGASGIGKTWFGMDFPSVFYVDVEGGGELPHYQDKLARGGGRYFGREDGSQDFKVVNDLIKWLGSNRHDYRTLVIDSFTKLYLTEAARAEERLGNDFGKDRKEANKPTRRMIQRADGLDMNVIFVCHTKDVWRNNERAGTSFDGYDKMEYELHLWLEATRRGKDRLAVVRKSRLTGFQEGEIFPLAYDEFAARYGRDIMEAGAKPVEIASAAAVADLVRLVELLKVPEETVAKWLDKAHAEKFADMPAEAVAKCTAYLRDQIKSTATKGEENAA